MSMHHTEKAIVITWARAAMGMLRSYPPDPVGAVRIGNEAIDRQIPGAAQAVSGKGARLLPGGFRRVMIKSGEPGIYL